jgi:peptide/nickel transport system ATP-binding protein
LPQLLTIRNLSIQFSNEGENTYAVKNVSIEIMKGELVAIVGESGSGKSVTALSVLQLLPKQAGVRGNAVFFQREKRPVDLLKLTHSSINDIRGKNIAMIFQEPMTSLNPVYTCGDQVMEAIRLHQQVTKKEARKKTIELFEKVKLPEPETFLNRYPHQISGGQKQRVMIAMAMSCDPTLLIADEPTTALDVTVQKSILELIRSLQEQNNMGVILITHDLGVVADVADKIVVMYKGEVVEQGEASQILHAPKHPYTKALLACRPSAQQKGKRLAVVSDFMGPEAKESTSEKEKKVIPFDPVAKDANLWMPEVNIYQEAPTVLDVRNLTISFPVKKNLFGKTTRSFYAVDNVSFKVKQGDIVGLVGESGCGKTTLGRSILQLIRPSSGTILLYGSNITNTKAAVLRALRKDLQIVFQDPYGSLNPRITIGEAILEPLKVHSVLNNNSQRKEKVMALLEKVNLDTGHYNRYPHQFSGGQRQRICIARALALDPSFLVFDEAVSALDVSVQAQVLNLLSDLKKELGFTALFISHDLSVVHYICNRILVMHKGKIAEEGNADEIYYRPQNEYTQQLLNTIPGKSLSQFSNSSKLLIEPS